MKTEKNILIAFLLNLSFSIFELVGGFWTGSVAIMSDAVHDMGDSASIGFSYFMEKKSRKMPDHIFTYGYMRYSVIGSVITTLILLIGSVFVIYHAILRLIHPVAIRYDGMIVFAIFGVIVNFAAAYFTREGDSLNQKAVNLHMLEDVLGWVIVLIGAIIMRFTDFVMIDSILSIGVAIFIFYHALRNLKLAIDLFLEKLPQGMDLEHIRGHILEIKEVLDVHHIHIWSIDGQRHYATMHIVTEGEGYQIKTLVKQELKEHGIGHATIELERPAEKCPEADCCPEKTEQQTHHHHHHHHHHH